MKKNIFRSVVAGLIVSVALGVSAPVLAGPRHWGPPPRHHFVRPPRHHFAPPPRHYGPPPRFYGYRPHHHHHYRDAYVGAGLMFMLGSIIANANNYGY